MTRLLEATRLSRKFCMETMLMTSFMAEMEAQVKSYMATIMKWELVLHKLEEMTHFLEAMTCLVFKL